MYHGCLSAQLRGTQASFEGANLEGHVARLGDPLKGAPSLQAATAALVRTSGLPNRLADVLPNTGSQSRPPFQPLHKLPRRQWP